MADLSELKVQLTLSLVEMRDLVALLNLANETMQASGMEPSPLVEEFSTMYFDTVDQVGGDGYLAGFEPE